MISYLFISLINFIDKKSKLETNIIDQEVFGFLRISKRMVLKLLGEKYNTKNPNENGFL